MGIVSCQTSTWIFFWRNRYNNFSFIKYHIRQKTQHESLTLQCCVPVCQTAIKKIFWGFGGWIWTLAIQKRPSTMLFKYLWYPLQIYIHFSIYQDLLSWHAKFIYFTGKYHNLYGFIWICVSKFFFVDEFDINKFFVIRIEFSTIRESHSSPKRYPCDRIRTNIHFSGSIFFKYGLYVFKKHSTKAFSPVIWFNYKSPLLYRIPADRANHKSYRDQLQTWQCLLLHHWVMQFQNAYLF